jgi:hypothetical protein
LFSFVSIFLFYFRLDPDVTSSTVIVGAQKKKRPRRVVGWHLVCLLLPDIANKAGRRRDDASVTTSSGWVSRNRAQPGEDRRPNTHNTGTNKRKNNSRQKPPHHFVFFFHVDSILCWIPSTGSSTGSFQQQQKNCGLSFYQVRPFFTSHRINQRKGNDRRPIATNDDDIGSTIQSISFSSITTK